MENTNNNQETNVPKADWFLNSLQGNTQNVDLLHETEYDFVLEDKEKYKKKKVIKELDLFKDKSGEFSDEKFDKFYNDELEKFNSYEKEKFTYQNIFVDTSDKTISNLTGIKSKPFRVGFEEKFNPFMQKESIYSLDVQENREFTMGEVARQQNGWEDADGKWHKLDGQVGAFNVPIDKVLAIAADDKGRPKLREGRFYYEEINGKDVYNRQLFSRFDGLTDEGSWANQYDFINSNDIEKSLTGTVAKTAAQIGLAFVPYIGQVYAYGTILKSGLDAGAQVLKSIDSIGEEFDIDLIEDDSSINTFQGMLRQFSTSQSEYAQENPFSSFEAWGGILSDVVLQLKQQTALGLLPSQLKAATNPKAVQAYAAKSGLTTKQIYQNANEMEKALGTSFDLYKKIGENVSSSFMATTAAMGVVDQAKQANLDETDQGLLYLGLTAAFGTLFKSDLGNWALKGVGVTEIQQTVKEAVKSKAGEFFNLGKMTGAAKQAKALKLGKEIGENINKNYTNMLKAGVTGYGGAAAAEGLEEGTEVVLQESLKTIYNGLSKLGLTSTKDGKFEVFNEKFLEELVASIGVGAVGGVVFKGIQGLPNYDGMDMHELVFNGYGGQVLKEIERQQNSKKGLASKNLSVNFSKKDGNIIYNAFNKDDIKDVNHNDMIAELMKQEVYKNIFLQQDLGTDDVSRQVIKEQYEGLFNGRLQNNIESLIQKDMWDLTTEALKVNKEIEKIKADSLNIDENSQDFKYKQSQIEEQNKKLEYINEEITKIKDKKKSSYYLDFSLFNTKKDLYKEFFDGLVPNKDRLAKEEYFVDYDKLQDDEKVEVDKKYAKLTIESFNNKKKAFEAYKEFYNKKAEPKVKKLNEELQGIIPAEQIQKNYIFLQNLESLFKGENNLQSEFLKEYDFELSEETFNYKNLEEDQVKNKEKFKEFKNKQKNFISNYVLSNKGEKLTEDEVNDILEDIDSFDLDDYKMDFSKIFNPVLEKMYGNIDSFTVDQEILEESEKYLQNFFGDFIEKSSLFLTIDEIANLEANAFKSLNNKYKEVFKNKPPLFLRVNKDDYKIKDNSTIYKNSILKNGSLYLSNKPDVLDSEESIIDFFSSVFKDDSLESKKELKSKINKILINDDYLDFDLQQTEDSYFSKAYSVLRNEIYDNLKKAKNQNGEDIYVNPINLANKQYNELSSKINEQIVLALDESTPYASSVNEQILKQLEEDLNKHLISVIDTNEQDGSRNSIINLFKKQKDIKSLDLVDDKDPLFTQKRENMVGIVTYLSNLKSRVQVLKQLLNENKDNLTPQIKSKAQKTFITYFKTINDVLLSKGKNRLTLESNSLLKLVSDKLENNEEIVFKGDDLATVYKEMASLEDKFRSSLTEEESKQILEALSEVSKFNNELGVPTDNEIKYEYGKPVDFTDYQKYQYIHMVLNSDNSFYYNLSESITSNDEFAPVFEQEYALRLIDAYLNEKYKYSYTPSSSLEGIDSSNTYNSVIDLINSVFVNGIPGAGKTQFMQRLAKKLNNYNIKYYAPGKSQLENSKKAFKGFEETAIEGGNIDSLYVDLGVGERLTLVSEKLKTVEANTKGFVSGTYTPSSIEDVEIDSTNDNFENIDFITFDEATNIDIYDLKLINKALESYNQVHRKNKKPLKIMYLGDTEQFGALSEDNLDVSLKSYGNIYTIPKLNQTIRANWKQLNKASSQIRKYIKEVELNKDAKPETLEFEYSLNTKDGSDFIGVYVGENNQSINNTIKNNKSSYIIIDDKDENGNFVHANEIISSFGKEALVNVFTPKTVQGREAEHVILYADPINFVKGAYKNVRNIEWVNTMYSRAKKGVVFYNGIGDFEYKIDKVERGFKESLFDDDAFLKDFKEERLKAYQAVSVKGEEKPKKETPKSKSKGKKKVQTGTVNKNSILVNQNMFSGYSKDINTLITDEDIDLLIEGKSYDSLQINKIKKDLLLLTVLNKIIKESSEASTEARNIYTELFKTYNDKLISRVLDRITNNINSNTEIFLKRRDYTYNSKGKEIETDSYFVVLKMPSSYDNGEVFLPLFQLKKETVNELKINLENEGSKKLGEGLTDLEQILMIENIGSVVNKTNKADEIKNRRRNKANFGNNLISELDKLTTLTTTSRPIVITGNDYMDLEGLNTHFGKPVVIFSRKGKNLNTLEEIKNALLSIKDGKKDFYIRVFDTMEYSSLDEVLEFAENKEKDGDPFEKSNLILSLTSKMNLIQHFYDTLKKEKEILKESGETEEMIKNFEKNSLMEIIFFNKRKDGTDYVISEEVKKEFLEILERGNKGEELTSEDKKFLFKNAIDSDQDTDNEDFVFNLIDIFSVLKNIRKVKEVLEENNLELIYNVEKNPLFKGVHFETSAKKIGDEQNIAALLTENSYSSIFNNLFFYRELDIKVNKTNFLQKLEGQQDMENKTEEETKMDTEIDTKEETIINEETLEKLELVKNELKNESDKKVIDSFISNPNDENNYMDLSGLLDALSMTSNDSFYEEISKNLPCPL